MAIQKYYLNLAGEYRVCAELLKRDIFATVTFGNLKGVDVVAVGGNRRAAIVEVKASNSSNFVTKFYQKYTDQTAEHPEFWVLYSASLDARKDRFFVLSHEELARKQAERNKRGNMSYEDCVRESAGGVDNVLIGDVQVFEDRWDKIITYCTSSGTPSVGEA